MYARAWRTAAASALVASLLASVALAAEPAAAQEAAPRLVAAPGRYIVVLDDQVVDASAADTVARLDEAPGVAVDQRYAAVFTGFAAEIWPSAAEDLAADPGVAGIYPDMIQSAFGQTVPNGVDRVDADKHPTRAGDGRSATIDADIAVVDTGVARNADLTLAGGVDCTGGRSPYADDNGHGTFVAGLAAAKDNGGGIVGSAPGARVWSVKVLDARGNGTISGILCGLDWVAQRSGTIEVANLSLGGAYPYNPSCIADPYHRAFCTLRDRGVTVVVAAGNGGSDASLTVPAAYAEVITVSALADSDGRRGGRGPATSNGRDDSLATFSNYGAPVDVAAPGVDMTSLKNASGGIVSGSYWSGTSFATPLVAGAAALVLRDAPGSSPATVKRRLLEAAEPGTISGDRDTYPEPVLSVGFLGRGSVTTTPSATPGDRLPVEIANFAAGSRVSIAFDGRRVGTVTADANGEAALELIVPLVPEGSYDLEASNTRKRDVASIAVAPRISLSARSGLVGDIVRATLRGFGPGDSILLTMETGPATRDLVRVRATSTGRAGASFVVPASTAGDHRITATGSGGGDAAITFIARPSLRATVVTATTVEVELRGFLAGETIALGWDDPVQTLTSTQTLATGSKNLRLTIPTGTAAGPHTLSADGTTNDATASIIIPAARSATPTPNPTSTPSPSQTATPAPTSEVAATPTETSTPSDTATATTLPTDVSTDTPTALPTETPTALPTETPTPVPTETPIPTDTPTSTPIP